MTTILSEEDVFQIAYLTMKGWECNFGYWEKDNVSQLNTAAYSGKKTKTTLFSRLEAFDKQLELDGQDKKSPNS